jgi:tetratricopeptide (TPR) repeat protein
MPPSEIVAQVGVGPSTAADARGLIPRRRWLRWFLALDLLLVVAALGTYRYVTADADRLDAALKWLSEQVSAAVAGAVDGGYDKETARLIAETAEPVLFRVLALGGDTPVMAHRRGWINIQLSRSYDVIGDPARQLAFAEAGKRAFERALAMEPSSREWRRDLAAVEDDLGNAFAAAGDLDGALRHHREGRRLVQMLLAEDPANTQLKGDLAASLGKLGRHYLGRGWRAQGTSHLWQGRNLIRELLVLEPDNARWQGYLRVFDRMIGAEMATATELSASPLPRL